MVKPDTSNHTPPHIGNISLRPASSTYPSFIVVGNGSTLSVILVGVSLVLVPFYLTDVLVAPGPIQNLIYARRLNTNNSCSRDFDHFSFFMKDLACKHHHSLQDVQTGRYSAA
jgi:hypothetical protein